MRDRVRTLVVYASGAPRWERVAVDTLSGRLRLRRLAGAVAARVPRRWQDNPYFRALVSDGYRNLSYVLDWQSAFCGSPRLAVDSCNINDLVEYRAALRRLPEYELVVVLHSAAGDDMRLLRRAASRFQARRGRLVLFVGNEYALMADKIAFAREVAADFIASQLPRPAAEWLYAECTRSKIILAPAALNPDLYRPGDGPRPVDVGFRGDRHGYALGDTERTDALRLFQERAGGWGLTADIAYVRCARERWSEFLRACKGIVGAESGTYYLERDDRTGTAVAAYLRAHPDAAFGEVYQRFFREYRQPVSGKAVSSRHFEAVGTLTCQILVEGEYNGILVADEHYLSLKKDFSNAEEVVRRFKDEGYRRAMVERAYAHVAGGHTYRHRVEAVLRAVGAGGP